MLVTRLGLRNFRTYESAEIALAPGLTVICGRNGAGKTNLLEAIYFGCTGRSCRTTNEREVVFFGKDVTRLELEAVDGARPISIAVGFQPGQPKRFTVDDAPVERLADVTTRPLASVFLPDRLELVVGPPALRRAHLDQLVAALWPSRRGTRTAYGAALAQRNALLARIRAGRSSRESLPAWDAEFARHAIELMRDRREAIEAISSGFTETAATLALEGKATLAYRPRSKSVDAASFALELSERVDEDLERGFTMHGPHRDELVLRRDGRDLRVYGSRGQQRLGLLALLLAERREIAGVRGNAPLLLLDDVMSELDPVRRKALADLLLEGGQSVVTTTDMAHVPGADGAGVRRLHVADGTILSATGDPGERLAS